MPRKKSIDEQIADGHARMALVKEVYEEVVYVVADQHLMIECQDDVKDETTAAVLVGIEATLARIVMMRGREKYSKRRTGELSKTIREMFYDPAFRAKVVAGMESDDNDYQYMVEITRRILGLAVDPIFGKL